MQNKSILFLRVAWMNFYEGDITVDVPYGAGDYVTVNKDGGEVVNFKPFNGKYYVYARIQNNRSLRIERLGAKLEDKFIDHVEIVLFAKNPLTGGQYVVGWFNNARVFRNQQVLNQGERHGYPVYRVLVKLTDGYLVPTQLRKLEIPSDGPGQTNAWYVMEYAGAKKFLANYKKFKNNPKTYLPNAARAKIKSAWQPDIEKRKQVEMAAMNATALHFESLGCKVNWVHNEKVGWDLEAVKGKVKILIEVKGLSNALRSVELTPNEFKQSAIYQKYTLCIFEFALDKLKRKLHICHLSHDKKSWITEEGLSLKMTTVESARITLF